MESPMDIGLPQFCPQAPQWVWGIFVWLGAGLIVIGILLALKEKWPNLFLIFPKSKRDWNIRDALEWWVQVNGFNMGDGEVLDFFTNLRQEAMDGNVMVWGRLNSEHRSPSGYWEPLQKIPPEHWGNNIFDDIGYLQADDRDDERVRSLATPPGTDHVPPGTRYVDLHVSSKEIRKNVTR